MKLDHFMYAMPSLDEGLEWAKDTFGVDPVYGGEHQGLGTRNALLSLGDCYLEIIAPDPGQKLDGTMGEQLNALNKGGLVTWAAEADLGLVKSQLNSLSVNSRGPVETKREQPDGNLLIWQLLFPTSGLYGMPFFIDWMACRHPAQTSPVAGQVRSFKISTPKADVLAQLFDAIRLEVRVEAGEPALSVHVEGAVGIIELSSYADTCDIVAN